jgi:hypothetical protein
LVIDTALAAALPDRSTIVPTNLANRIDNIERKGCTLSALLLLLLLRRLLLRCLLRLLRLHSSVLPSVTESLESSPSPVNVKIFQQNAKRNFPLTPIDGFDR